MKRIAILVGLLLCAGCFTAAPPPALITMPPLVDMNVKAFPAVLPEQINEQNAHQRAQELEDELNREQQRLTLSTGSRERP
ncbi:MAG: hypothetical protein FJ303_02005 [Planctomycetes bacterium]|nr:hypothetical protein [Planctomycetota bacterium]